ncbi:hypothetical protein BH10ACT3_BH10ACT3_09510 [soil metagenome]
MSDRARTGQAAGYQPDFDRLAAERILRRAVHLADQDDATTADEGISEQALVEAAEELGVDVAVVRRAVQEERLGLLLEVRHFGDGLVGPGTLTVSRIVAGRPDQVLDRVDAWLRKLGALRRQRRDATSASYGRRGDVVATVQRASRSITGAEDLRRVRRLSVVATPIDPERSMVVIVADMQLERTLAVASGSGVAGVGSAVAVAEVVAWSPWFWLGIPASLAAGAGLLLARAHGVPDVEASIEGVLDRVAAGDLPPSVLSGVTERVLRNFGRSQRLS